MRRILIFGMILATAAVLCSCFNASQPPEQSSDTTQPTENTQTESPLPNNTASGSAVYSFAHAAEIYANPDAYKGKEFSSPFTIVSERRQTGDTFIYYANGYSNGSEAPAYALLEFAGENIPDLKNGSAVYARGTIQGAGALSDDKGNAVSTLWLTVTEMETDSDTAAITTPDAQFRFGSGEYKAVQGPLSIEVTLLSFTEDGLMLSTKTTDSSVKGYQTYYFDIIVHQGGYFAWFHNCKFWINGSAGYDNVPFPPLSSEEDISIEFVPFSKDGKLLYEPLVIDIPLSQMNTPVAD